MHCLGDHEELAHAGKLERDEDKDSGAALPAAGPRDAELTATRQDVNGELELPGFSEVAGDCVEVIVLREEEWWHKGDNVQGMNVGRRCVVGWTPFEA